MQITIDAGALLKELDAQWALAGKSEQNGVLRASSMTLIVFADSSDEPQALGETLADLMHDHPNRSIVVRVGGAELAARTTIQCWMPHGGRQQICCEQFEIAAPERALDAVAPALRGLLVADLPVVVWLKDLSLVAVDGIRPLLELAGKVIVDTSRCESAAEAAAVLARLSDGSWQLADLAWARITRWRELIAQRLRRGDWPQRAERAEIAWAGAALPVTAAYLAAWLGLVFDWPEITPERVQLPCYERIVENPEGGRIRSVRLRSGPCSLDLERAAGPKLGIVLDELHSSAVFPLFSAAALLAEELSVFGKDDLYLRVYRRLGEVAGR